MHSWDCGIDSSALFHGPPYDVSRQRSLMELQRAVYGASPTGPGPPLDFIGPLQAVRCDSVVVFDGNRFQHHWTTSYCFPCGGTGLVYQESFYSHRAGWKNHATGEGDAGDLIFPESLKPCSACATRRSGQPGVSKAWLEAYYEALAPRCGICRSRAMCGACSRRKCLCQSDCVCEGDGPARCPTCKATMMSPAMFTETEHRSTCSYMEQRKNQVLIELGQLGGVFDHFGNFAPDFLAGLIGNKYLPLQDDGKTASTVHWMIAIGWLPWWPPQGAKLKLKPFPHLVPNPEPKKKRGSVVVPAAAHAEQEQDAQEADPEEDMDLEFED